MSKLLTKKQWEKKYSEFCLRYPWLTYRKNIELCPGYLGAVDRCFNDLEDMLKQVGIDKVTFSGLYVRGVGNKSLGIYAEFNPSIGSALIELCNHRIQDTINLTQEVCLKCGAYIHEDEVVFGRTTGFICEEHSKFEGVFSEDYEEWKGAQIRKITQQAQVEIEASEFESDGQDVGSDEEDSESAEEHINRNPSLKLYDLAEVVATKTNKSNDRQVNMKRKELVKQMEELGETRPFCDVPDASLMATHLKSSFPNFVEVIEFIETYVVLARMTGKLRIPPLLLEGPAAIGKTAFVSAIAKIFNTAFIEVHMENEQSNSTLAGSSEFWGNSQTGIMFEALVFGKTCNPLVLIDEVDKASSTHGSNPLSPLYQFLERDTAKKFRDLSFRSVALDASQAMWILTANDASAIDPPILSRMRRFDIQPPTAAQAEIIAQRIYTKILEQNEWVQHFNSELSQEAAQKLAALPLRLMQAELEAALGRVAKAGRTSLQVCDILGNDSSVKRGMGFLWQEDMNK